MTRSPQLRTVTIGEPRGIFKIVSNQHQKSADRKVIMVNGVNGTASDLEATKLRTVAGGRFLSRVQQVGGWGKVGRPHLFKQCLYRVNALVGTSLVSAAILSRVLKSF